MSLTALEHALMLGRLLPEGPAWPTSEQSGGADDFNLLVRALANEPARVGASYDLIVEEAIPDNANTDLDHWELIVGIPVDPLTDDERLDRIRALLNGPDTPDRSTLEEFIRHMAGNDDVKLFNRAGPRSAAGLMQCGDRLRGGPWEYAALCELMPNVLSVGPDAFEAWTGFGAAGPSVISPVTLAATADQFPVPSSSYASAPLNAPDGATVYASVWIFIAGTGTHSIVFGLLGRDNVASETPYVLTKGVWHRIEHEGPIGTGVVVPLLRLKADSSAPVACLSWAVAGVRDLGLQDRIMERFPLHTYCHFGVIGEYETLLSQDPIETSW